MVKEFGLIETEIKKHFTNTNFIRCRDLEDFVLVMSVNDMTRILFVAENRFFLSDIDNFGPNEEFLPVNLSDKIKQIIDGFKEAKAINDL